MRWIWMTGLAGWLMVPVQAAEPLVQIETRAGELGIRLGEVEVARYVFRDPQVSRS